MNTVKRNRSVDLLAHEQQASLLPPDPPSSPVPATPPLAEEARAPVEAKTMVVTIAPDDLFPVLPVDPRPDIVQDTRQWNSLLKALFVEDGEKADGLFGLVHGMRCCGARIVPDAKFRYVLKPGEIGGKEWNGDQAATSEPQKSGFRGLLKPWAAQITTHLADLP